jgi:hypothetical protein
MYKYTNIEYIKDMAHIVNTEFIDKFKLTEEDKPSL